MKITGLALAAIVVSALAAQGCVPHHHYRQWGGSAEPAVARRGGPPPHAPAHGHRHKHHDTSGTKVTLQFDTDLGVYVVLGHRDHYWSGDRYFRWSGEHWEVSTALAGGWTVVVRGSLPHRLAAKHADHKARHKSKAHHKKRKQIPAKHRH